MKFIRVKQWQSLNFEKKSWGGEKWGNNILGAFSMFFLISLHPVIKIFLICTYVMSSTLSLGKPHVRKKSGSGCIAGARPLFWIQFRQFWRVFTSIDTVIWTTRNLDSMYSRYTYLEIKNNFTIKLYQEGFIRIDL